MNIDDIRHLVRPARPGWTLGAISHDNGDAGAAVVSKVRLGAAKIGLCYDGTIAVSVGDEYSPSALLTLDEVRDLAAQLVAVADLVQ